jgi:DNA-methyltransferase (dcm)
MKKLNELQLDLWDRINNIGFDYQSKLNALTRKQTGIYYTDLYLAGTMIEKLFYKMDSNFIKKIHEKTFFEPCVGVGNFVFSYLKYIYQNLELTEEQVDSLLNNIYVSDSDENSKSIFLKYLKEFIEVFWSMKLPDNFEKSNVGAALIYNIENKEYEKIIPSKYFLIEKFDIIVTNPPYKGFRAESKHYELKQEYERDKNYYELLKKSIKLDFDKQGKGSTNLYKIFVEEILKNYLSSDGYAYLLIPQSILKDKSSTELREYLLSEKKLYNVLNVDEDSKFVDAKQALSALLVGSKGNTSTIDITNHFGTSKEQIVSVTSEDVKDNINSAIVGLSNEDITLIRKLRSYPKLENLKYITNLRGELDLTINKKSISSSGKFQLLRGRNLAPFILKFSDTTEYVLDEFIDKSSKAKHVRAARISCPQISNMSAKKRLFFSYVPEGYILGNSCNFINVSENNDNVDIYYLLALFNSDIYDWYFRLFSSNNHINNYEINSFPIPIVDKRIHIKLSKLAKSYIKEQNIMTLAEINEIVFKVIHSDNESIASISNEQSKKLISSECISDIINAFPELTQDDLINYAKQQKSLIELSEIANFSKFDIKVFESIFEKYSVLDNGEVLNHTSFKLSDLDMEMVKSVLPGGNWKDIPLEVASKSKRLMRIRETGGRTTLYGRLDYSKPSYTITTYFNRPGNGTNIHPVHNRVMSVREAARIQSFPDNFYFFGNKKNKLNQIGNAIPPLMSYQIGKKIKEKISVNNSLDLFNGAGGMTIGFKLAGYHSVLMNDIDEAALVTAKVNCPSSKVFLADLTNQESRDYIIKYAKEKNVDIVNGGPPCQGFSMAGFRNINDPRSKLIFDYVVVLKGVKPKVFVFENVQGLLSHDNGNTFNELIHIFDEIGYNVEARLLDFSDYGIPQKRRRVIIIGTRKELNVDPKELFPLPKTTNDKEKIKVKDALFDLESVHLDEKSYYVDCELSEYVKVLKNDEIIDDYISILSK